MASQLGYALAQGLGAAAGSASGMLEDQMKAEAQEAAAARMANRQLETTMRLEASREKMRELAELRKIQQKRDNAKAIDTEAEGMLASGRAAKEQTRLGELAAQDDTLSPEEIASLSPEGRARYGLPPKEASEIERLRARGQAAEKLGMLDEAKETRGMLDTERKFVADKEKDERGDRRLDIMQKIEENRALRAEALQRATLARAEAADKNATERAKLGAEKEQREATSKALTNVSADIKQLETQLTSGTLDPASEKTVKEQVLQLRQEQNQYRQALANRGIPQAPTEAANTPPSNRPPLSSFRRDQ